MSGNTISKEEEKIIIPQANGVSNATQEDGFSFRDYMEMVFGAMVVMGIIIYVYKMCKRRLDKKIRREITASSSMLEAAERV